MILEAEKIKLGFIGGGPNSLIGQMHQIAAAMHDQYDLVGGILEGSSRPVFRTLGILKSLKTAFTAH